METIHKNMIVKVYNLNRSTNRLVGYAKVSELDFTEIIKNNKTELVPNEHFYRKIKKALKTPWLPFYGWRFLKDREIQEIIDKYGKKIDFYAKQKNVLETLLSLS